MSAAKRTAERIKAIAPGAVCVTRETWIYDTENKEELWRIWSDSTGVMVRGGTLKEAETKMIAAVEKGLADAR